MSGESSYAHWRDVAILNRTLRLHRALSLHRAIEVSDLRF